MRGLIHAALAVAVVAGLALGWWAHGAADPGPRACHVGATAYPAGTYLGVSASGDAWSWGTTGHGQLRLVVCSGGSWVFPSGLPA
jgi:hypothetical protein